MNKKCERCGKELPQGTKPYLVSATQSVYLCYDCAEPWEPRVLANGLVLALQAGDVPTLVLTQGDQEIRIEFADVIPLVAALTDAAADLAGLLATGERCHA